MVNHLTVGPCGQFSIHLGLLGIKSFGINYLKQVSHMVDLLTHHKGWDIG